jgi:3-oxoacyl-[acyl-carrier protein] reductase
VNAGAARRRVAVVTRAGAGMAAVTAAQLAADGMAVLVVDDDLGSARATADAITSAGGMAAAAGFDVRDPAGARGAAETASRLLGPPSVLVNSAGPTGAQPFADVTLTDFDLVLRDNLTACFLMAQAMLPAFGEHGRIINVAGMASLGMPGQAGYAAAMAGIEGLTRALAVELGPRGITVNAVAPGFIAGSLTEADAAQFGVAQSKVERVVAARAPVRRIGTPEDVANAIAFLASEEAGFISGQTVLVNGGLML